VAAARAKALEDEKVKAYLEKKAAMEAAKVCINLALAFSNYPAACSTFSRI
jgi:hypothetical protein